MTSIIIGDATFTSLSREAATNQSLFPLDPYDFVVVIEYDPSCTEGSKKYANMANYVLKSVTRIAHDYHAKVRMGVIHTRIVTGSKLGVFNVIVLYRNHQHQLLSDILFVRHRDGIEWPCKAKMKASILFFFSKCEISQLPCLSTFEHQRKWSNSNISSIDWEYLPRSGKERPIIEWVFNYYSEDQPRSPSNPGNYLQMFGGKVSSAGLVDGGSHGLGSTTVSAHTTVTTVTHSADAITLESPHPYQTCLDERILVAIPGVEGYMVSFDSLSSLESNVDFIRYSNICGLYIFPIPYI